MRGVVLFMLIIAVAAAYAVYRGFIVIPDRWNPWAPLRIADLPNGLTRWKLARLESQPQMCHEVLAAADMMYVALPERTDQPGCEVVNAVRISRTTARVGEPFSLTCGSAVSLALWETHVLQPSARRYFGAPVARIEHFGSYACRNVYGRENGARSQHATANAIDIAGFALDDGRRIRVVSDWNDTGGKGGFLHAVRGGACRFYGAVLGPDYNAAHRDHLHFDRGPYRVCR